VRNLHPTLQKEIIDKYNNYEKLKDLANFYSLDLIKLRYWIKKNPHVKWRGGKQFSLNEDYFKKECANQAYILGFLSADGCIRFEKKAWNLRVEIQQQDVEFLEFLKKELEFNGNIRFYSKKTPKNKDGFYCRVDIRNNTMGEDLINNGVIPNKTYNFKLPPVAYGPYSNHFMRGYFDGDGCITTQSNKTRHNYFFSLCVNKEVAQDFIDLIYQKSGVKLHKYNYSKISASTAITCESKESIRKMYEWLYADSENSFSLSRKKERFELAFENSLIDRVDLRKKINNEVRLKCEELFEQGVSLQKICDFLQQEYQLEVSRFPLTLARKKWRLTRNQQQNQNEALLVP